MKNKDVAIPVWKTKMSLYLYGKQRCHYTCMENKDGAIPVWKTKMSLYLYGKQWAI